MLQALSECWLLLTSRSSEILPLYRDRHTDRCFLSTLPFTFVAAGLLKGAGFPNGSSSQRRRFNPQYHNNRLNGSAKPQGGGNEADLMAKGNNRHEHRRQPHNGFRPKNKGGAKNQEAPLGTKTPEAPAHSEKPRRRQHAVDNSEARPFRGNVARVSQCNLCPTRIEVSTDATVLSVPAVTLVA
ncbi:SPATS2-like protein [Lontra canadensis]|uniref:SPATS2-like protein n=1 Tax=Lontra canadensis TaxID=76717 RepID=UPI0013F329E0|nr:SPATS2-like protein [Lontra canadensis]